MKNKTISTTVTALLLAAVMMFACVACGDTKTSVATDATTTPETSDVTSNELSAAEQGIGGGGASTYYLSLFDRYVELVFTGVMEVKPNTGSFYDLRSDEVNAVFEKYDTSNDRKERSYHDNILWYVVHELGITRDELAYYNSTLDDDMKLTDEQIDMLMVEDEIEARRLQRSRFTLFADGEIFIVKEIEAMTKEEFASHNFPKEDVEALIANIDASPELLNEENCGESLEIAVANARAFADEKIAKIRSLAGIK